MFSPSPGEPNYRGGDVSLKSDTILQLATLSEKTKIYTHWENPPDLQPICPAASLLPLVPLSVQFVDSPPQRQVALSRQSGGPGPLAKCRFNHVTAGESLPRRRVELAEYCWKRKPSAPLAGLSNFRGTPPGRRRGETRGLGIRLAQTKRG